MQIAYQLTKKPQPIFNAFKRIVRGFTGNIKCEILGEKMDNNCIYLCNHANKIGPLIFEMYLPIYSVKWGAGEMLGSYKERYSYLKDVLYIQKNHYTERKAKAKAFYEAFFSKYIYKGIRVLPTYKDFRLTSTIKKSIQVLENDTAIVIFPENAKDGYFDEMQSFHLGFTLLAEKYYKKTNKDIALRPVYYHKRKKTILVGEKVYYKSLVDNGLNRNMIAEELKNQVNNLYYKIENAR